MAFANPVRRLSQLVADLLLATDDTGNYVKIDPSGFASNGPGITMDQSSARGGFGGSVFLNGGSLSAGAILRLVAFRFLQPNVTLDLDGPNGQITLSHPLQLSGGRKITAVDFGSHNVTIPNGQFTATASFSHTLGVVPLAVIATVENNHFNYYASAQPTDANTLQLTVTNRSGTAVSADTVFAVDWIAIA